MRHQKELIVPIRDRRQRKRMLTFKNFRWAALIFAVLFIGLTIRSEMRHEISEGYGRLFGKQVSGQTEVAKPKYDVVREAPVADRTAADPFLVQPAARAQQYLGVDPATTREAAVVNPAMTGQSLDTPRGKGPAIVGDDNG